MGLIHDHHGYLVHHFIIIYPRIEQGIDQRHDDAEDQHALIAEHLLDLLSPDVGGILKPMDYLMEYRHNEALRF